MQYVVTNRSGGNTETIFKDKTKAISFMNESNKNHFNSVVAEYTELPNGYIITKPIQENITSASCACIKTKNFDYCTKVPLSDFDDYVTGKKIYTEDFPFIEW